MLSVSPVWRAKSAVVAEIVAATAAKGAAAGEAIVSFEVKRAKSAETVTLVAAHIVP